MRSGWKETNLGEVCELISRGIAPKYVESGGIPVINQKCIRDHRINYDLSRRHNLELRAVKPERYIKTGDVLVNSTGTGTLGRVAQVRSNPQEPTTVDTHVTIVRPIEGLFYPDFFGYVLINIEKEITDSGEGAVGQTELARTTLKERFRVKYPKSLPEQKRIVAILDEAFAGIDQAIANTEKNLANARELFESYLNGLSHDKQPLGEFVEIKTGKLNANAAVEGGEFPFFTCSRDIFAIDHHAFDCEAILLAGNNASGDFNVKHYRGKFNAYQRTYVITISDEARLNYKFLYYELVKSLKELKRSSVGAGTKFLKLGMIEGLKISAPPLDAQEEALAVLVKLEDYANQLDHTYKQKLATLAELKQSLLQKAFSGELTADMADREISAA